MNSINVKLDTIDKVKSFVNAVSRLEGDFDLVSNRYTVDAKSIMGIFSLDLSKELKLNISNGSEADNYAEIFKEFAV